MRDNFVTTVSYGGKEVTAINRPLIMGILNVTPDSFSDGGKNMGVANALRACEKLVKDGADIIDIGGESTRPGSVPVSAEEELSRIYKVTDEVLKEFDVMVSVDTYKAEVASEVLKLGAHIVNDVTALNGDSEMASLMARNSDRGIVLMRNGKLSLSSESSESSECAGGKNACFDEITSEIDANIDLALSSGILKSQILIDPGIGFNTDRAADLKLIEYTGKATGNYEFPYLFAVSRKRITDYMLGGNSDFEKRDDLTAKLNQTAYMEGASIVRTHNVRKYFELLGE